MKEQQETFSGPTLHYIKCQRIMPNARHSTSHQIKYVTIDQHVIKRLKTS